NDNTILVHDDSNESNRQNKGESTEAEALIEMERMMEQENPKIQPLGEDLEVINVGRGEEKKKVKIGEHIPLDMKRSLIELLREYVDVFAWSYRDMLSLDCKIVGGSKKSVNKRLMYLKDDCPAKTLSPFKEDPAESIIGGGSQAHKAIAKKTEFDTLGRGQEGSYEATYCRHHLSHLEQSMGKSCADYRRLNQATRKDHFPLPFIDQVLEK
ncbi:hypothetical protein CR513_42125, partial [Mucuna pruriens]